MTSSTILDLVAALSGVFQRLGIRWYLFGAQAAIVYGSTRLTADADVTVELGSRSIEDVVDGLQAAGFALRIADEDFVERTRVLPLVHTASEIAVDVVLAGPGLEELFLERARSVIFGSIEIPVVSPEDLLAMKLLAGRPHEYGAVHARPAREGIGVWMLAVGMLMAVSGSLALFSTERGRLARITSPEPPTPGTPRPEQALPNPLCRGPREG